MTSFRFRPSEIDILACTLWAEARGEGYMGMKAVAHVIINRVKSARFASDDTLASVCLRHVQFSCWNKNKTDPTKSDPNFDKMFELDLSSGSFAEATRAALDALHEPDFTNGSLHYYSTTMPQPPVWAVGREPCFTLGKHVFFNDVP